MSFIGYEDMMEGDVVECYVAKKKEDA